MCRRDLVLKGWCLLWLLQPCYYDSSTGIAPYDCDKIPFGKTARVMVVRVPVLRRARTSLLLM